MTNLRLGRDSGSGAFEPSSTGRPTLAWEAVPESLVEARRRAVAAFEDLTAKAQELIAGGWTAEEVFWSRYFWFSAVVRSSEELGGYDAGLQQQAFQLLEVPTPYCEPDLQHLAVIESAAKEALNAVARK